MKAISLSGFLLAAGLTLSACGAATPPAPAQAQLITTINGVLNGTAATTVILKAGAQVLSSATLDAGSHFSLTLPSEQAISSVIKPVHKGLLSGVGCSGLLSSSDAAAQGYDVVNLSTSGSLYLNATASKTLLSRALSGRIYLYVDRPTAVSGTLDCSALTGMPTKVPVNINVSKGWNVLGLTINGGVGLSGLNVSGRLGNSTAAMNELTTWTSENALKAQLSL